MKAGRNESPSYSLIDSQSAKTVYASEERGIDGGKKVKGRKRHIVTDTIGNILKVKIHASNIHDTIAGGEVFKEALGKYPSIKGFCADAGYRKTFEKLVISLGKTVKISEKIKPNGWAVLPQRWVVEYTFSWMSYSRRLSKDFEISTHSQENMVILSHLHTLLKSL